MAFSPRMSRTSFSGTPAKATRSQSLDGIVHRVGDDPFAGSLWDSEACVHVHRNSVCSTGRPQRVPNGVPQRRLLILVAGQPSEGRGMHGAEASLASAFDLANCR